MNAVPQKIVSQPMMFRGIFLPARCAYLIGARSADGLRRSVAEASTRWGGISEPIIPVRANGRVDGLWSQTVAVAEVQCVVNVDLDPNVAKRAAENLELPLVELSRIDREAPSVDSTFPLFVEEDVQLQRVRAPHDAPLWQVVAAGCWTDDAAKHLPEVSRYTGDVPAECRYPDMIGRAQLNGSTLIERTSAQFRPYTQRGGAPAPAVVWVTTANSFSDCLGFWNLRALRSSLGDTEPMVLVPHSEVVHWVGFDKQVEAVLRRQLKIEPDAIVVSTAARTKTAKVASLLGLVESESRRIGSSIDYPLPPNREPPFFYLGDVDPFRRSMFRREYGLTTRFLAHVHDGKAIVRFDSPLKLTGSGRHLMRLESEVFDGIPRRPATARLVHQNARWAGEFLEFSVSTATSSHHLDLHVPDLPEVVHALLQAKSPGAAMSDKGVLGERLQQLGLVDQLTFDAVPVIRELTTPRSKELVRELQTLGESDSMRAEMLDIASTWGGRAERRYRSISDLKSSVSPQAPAVAEELANGGWIDRGFEVRCTDCGVRSFVPLAETQGAAQCPACSSEQKFNGSSGPEVHYRLQGLLDRASDQGVLVHLVAEAELRRRFGNVFLLPGVDVSVRLQPEEVDLFGVCEGQLVVGEAKSSADQFTPKQVERDAGLAAALGADALILACPQPISRVVRDLAQALAKQAGMKIEFVSPESSDGEEGYVRAARSKI